MKFNLTSIKWLCQFNGQITKALKNDTALSGKLTLSITNCQEVQMMKGGLESMQGLEEVNITHVPRIVLRSSAFSGQHLKRVSGEVKVVDSINSLR